MFIIDRLFGVAGAFIGSQIPVFMHQYEQRLSGHLHELSHLLEEIRHIALLSGKSMDQYINKFLNSSDPDFISHGKFMQNLVIRHENLSKALYDLTTSTLWSKPYLFFSELKSDIASSTLHSFSPGMSLTVEGGVYALCGLVVGCLVYRGMKKLLSSVLPVYTFSRS